MESIVAQTVVGDRFETKQCVGIQSQLENKDFSFCDTCILEIAIYILQQ